MVKIRAGFSIRPVKQSEIRTAKNRPDRLVNLAMISKIAMARLAMVKNRDFEAIAMVKNQIFKSNPPLYTEEKSEDCGNFGGLKKK